jgi:DNA-binding MarR family transcriptional regulator
MDIQVDLKDASRTNHLTTKYRLSKNRVMQQDPDLAFGDMSTLGPVEEWPVGRLFAAAARLSGPVMWRLVERHGVSPAGFFLLRALTLENGLRAGELARRMMITPATVTSVVDTLERNGHVERRRDPSDRRAVLVHITDSGRRLVGETGHALQDDLWRLYDVVDEADEPAVRRFLLRLIERFDRFSGADHPRSPEGGARGGGAPGCAPPG